MKTSPNIPDPDGFYQSLVAAHEGLAAAVRPTTFAGFSGLV
jgi:hypothetical protein